MLKMLSGRKLVRMLEIYQVRWLEKAEEMMRHATLSKSLHPLLYYLPDDLHDTTYQKRLGPDVNLAR